MNRGNKSVIPFILAIAAIIVVVVGLRSILDRIDSAPGVGRADSEISIETDETAGEETESGETHVEESVSEDDADHEKSAGEEAENGENPEQDADIKEADGLGEDADAGNTAGKDAVAAGAEAVSGEEPADGEEPAQAASGLRFRSKKLLNDHYNKHGIDMGFGSAKEYEAAAAAVVANPSALHKTEKEDGDDVYYVEATNEFVVVSTDGYIRTYFCPDSGIKYYNKQ